MANKQEIIEAIKSEIAATQDIISLTLVGSHSDLTKTLERTNDFDFLVIFDQLTAERLTIFENNINEIAEKLDSPEQAIWTEFRVGPIKPLCPRLAEFCTMLHMLVFDKQSFADYIKVAPFITLDWLRFPALTGKNLAELFSVAWPTFEELVNAPRHSLAYYRKVIKEKVYVYVSLENKDGRLTPVPSSFPMNDEQFAEVCSNTLNKIMLNALIVAKKTNEAYPADRIVAEFLKYFPDFESERQELEKINGLKKKIRQGEKTGYDTETLEKFLMTFMDRLTERPN